jgi:hypothetical protein
MPKSSKKDNKPEKALLAKAERVVVAEPHLPAADEIVLFDRSWSVTDPQGQRGSTA